jgi:2-polyprenyl-6-methoxyphenol hydroxylase-like FAD-dependent oxidoreductase
VNVVVVGGGVAGLATALQLGRAGHEVTVIERDDTPMPATADEAFEWNRRGAPQVRHSHAFLARLRNLLRDHQPDILEALLAEGATEMRFGDGVPSEMEFTPEPGDDDLVMIACRRTTFEWVLRRAALSEANVTIRTGVAATGLLHEPTGPSTGPQTDLLVTGVRLDDGTDLAADLVVAANGRRNEPDRSVATSATSSTARSSATTEPSASRSPYRPTTTNSVDACRMLRPSTQRPGRYRQRRRGSMAAPSRSPPTCT